MLSLGGREDELEGVDDADAGGALVLGEVGELLDVCGPEELGELGVVGAGEGGAVGGVAGEGELLVVVAGELLAIAILRGRQREDALRHGAGGPAAHLVDEGARR